MSSAEFTVPRGGPVEDLRPAVRIGLPRAPRTVLWLLLAVTLVAVFDHGGVDDAASARLEVGAAAIGLVAAVAGLWSGSLRLRGSPMALLALGLLAGFCVWSAVSLAWSVAPERTWIEFNRTLLYVLCLALAIACGASWRRAPEALTAGLIWLGVAVCAYALGQKVLPGLHVGHLVNLDQAGAIPRLQEPIGYWNALALLLSLIAPLALARAVEPGREVRSRLAHLGLVTLLALTVALTLSRGGLIALAVALGVGLAPAGRPLRSLMWLALALLAAVPALIVGLTNHSLTHDDVPLGSRESAGLLLLAALAAGLLIGLLIARRILGFEARLAIAASTRRRIIRGLAAAAVAAVAVAVLMVALSARGLTGTISHAWHSFTITHGENVAQPGRLLSADSANRWVWWREAAGGFSDRPLGGWGAGSFPVVHLLYRRDTVNVSQAHSVPLQWLAETGAVGFLLAASAILLLVGVALRALREAATAPERAVRAALLGAGAAFAVHCLFDWDWDIPGVTLPALLCLGVLAGAASRDAPAEETGRWRPRPGWLIVLSAALCFTAISAALPSIAASRARRALVAASGESSAGLAGAAADARLAGRLDPLSDAGPLAAARIALHEGQRQLARTDLLDATHRAPSDPQAWADLSYVESSLGRSADSRRASRRAQELDPLSSTTNSLAGAVSAAGAAFAAPPADSASASQTP